MDEYQPITRESATDIFRTILNGSEEESIEKLLEVKKKQPFLAAVMLGCLSEVKDEDKRSYFLQIFLAVYFSCVNGEDDFPCIKLDELTKNSRNIIKRFDFSQEDVDSEEIEKRIDSISEPHLSLLVWEKMKYFSIANTLAERHAVIILVDMQELLGNARKEAWKNRQK